MYAQTERRLGDPSGGGHSMTYRLEGKIAGMSTSATRPKVPLDDLRESIACALAGATKSYELPAIAERLGLATGTGSEAHSSKRLYVRSRLLKFNEGELLKLAQAVLQEFSSDALADLVSEITTHPVHRIGEITRRDVLKALNPLESLFGDTPLFEGLSIIAGDARVTAGEGFG